MLEQRAQAPCSGVHCGNSEWIALNVGSARLAGVAHTKVGKPHKGHGAPGPGLVVACNCLGSVTNSASRSWLGLGFVQSDSNTSFCLPSVQKANALLNSVHRCSLVAMVVLPLSVSRPSMLTSQSKR